jgi:hypothetical protein
MRAVSVHQPWADLIVNGEKTEDFRSWKISHRGPLAIHASLKIDQSACEEKGINVSGLTTGAIVGYVNLVEIEHDEESGKPENPSKETNHEEKEKEKSTYIWKFNDPRPLEEPVPVTGRKGIFHVPDDIFLDLAPIVDEPEISDTSISLDSRAPFELRIINENHGKLSNGTYRLAIVQVNRSLPVLYTKLLNNQTMRQTNPPIQRTVSEVGGIPLKIVADAILEALRKNGYSATELNAQRQEAFLLSEESGVRLALIFLAIQSLKKSTRMEEISHGIQSMTAEELYYWFAKCTSSRNAERSLKALRLLLSDE